MYREQTRDDFERAIDVGTSSPKSSLPHEAAASGLFDETYDSCFGLIGSEAIMGLFDETYDSRFGLIGSEAIMV